jgi:putative glutamine amidotransferase
MTTPRVRIGISSCLMHKDPQRPIFKGKALQYTEEKMAMALWRAGAMPVGLLDLKSDNAALEQMANMDGLLLQGGADVAPESYGESPLQPAWGGDRERDEHEIRLIEAARNLGKPVLGICRGIQMLNVALGGSLYQDIGTQVKDALIHRDWNRYEDLEHEVRLETGSWASEIYEAKQLLVNTVHHQAIKDLAPGLRATAWAPDGVIEAVEWTREEGPWMAGIQWHPEWLDGSSEGGKHRSRGDTVFEAFSRVCADRR